MTISSSLQSLAAGALALLLGSAATSSAVVLFGPDESENVGAPPNGAPWKYVARVASGITSPASGVYLGNGYVLSADHVAPPLVMRINGTDYPVDTSYKSSNDQLGRQIDGVDLRMFRIIGDPGLPKLPLLTPAMLDRGKPCVAMGWGLGKGAAVPSQGWAWGDDATRIQRWGLNRTVGSYSNLPDIGIRVLTTAFNFGAGPKEYQLAEGDSGGPLFIKVGTTWRLAGIAVTVTTNGFAYYDRFPATKGMQADRTFYIPIRLHYAAIAAELAKP